MYGLGSALIVRQTPAVHTEIADLLEQLRSQGGAARTVTIKANWLFLDAAQFERLQESLGSEPIVEPPSDPKTEKAAGEGPPVYSPEKFKALVNEAVGYSGQIACFEGQTVHLISGKGKTVLDRGTPVVGGGAVAYDQSQTIVQGGALLQVTPRPGASENVLILDAHSVITQPDPPRSPNDDAGPAGGGGLGSAPPLTSRSNA